MSTKGRTIAFACAGVILVALFMAVARWLSPLNIEVAAMTEHQRIRVRDALTAEQLKNLDEWRQRTSAASNRVPPGVTVKQALLDEETWLAKQKADASLAEERRKRAQAAHEAKEQELARMVSVTLLSKKNEVHVDEQHYVALEIAYDNKTDKDIRSVAGVLKLSDAYGNAVIDINRSYGGGITAGQTAVDHGAVVSINKSLDPQERLWETDFDKLRATFDVDTITFMDGTTVKVSEEGARAGSGSGPDTGPRAGAP